MAMYNWKCSQVQSSNREKKSVDILFKKDQEIGFFFIFIFDLESVYKARKNILNFLFIQGNILFFR